MMSTRVPPVDAEDIGKYGEEQASGESAHQDAGESFDATDQAPFRRQHEIAITGGGVSDRAEIRGCCEVRHRAAPSVEERPDENLDQMQQHRPGGDADEHPGRVPELPVPRASRACIQRNAPVSPIA